MKLPRYALPVSLIGTLTGSAILVKDHMSGARYKGEERMAGKTVIVTGANTGIGKETTRELARRGARVIMACRDGDKCEIARKEIVLETANKSLTCKKLDLASFASIRAFVKGVLQSESHIDVLINNAGVMMCPKKKLTEDGLEMQLGVNHIGHFLLTYLLMDALKSSAPSRIIILSSIAHKTAEINFKDLNSADSYEKTEAYGQSKLANMLHQQELVKRLHGSQVTVNSVYPGIVDTEISRHLPSSSSFMAKIVFFPIKYFLMKTPLQGAQTVLHLAIDPSLEKVTGKYFKDCKETAPAPKALDEAAAHRLWAISEAWTRANES